MGAIAWGGRKGGTEEVESSTKEAAGKMSEAEPETKKNLRNALTGRMLSKFINPAAAAAPSPSPRTMAHFGERIGLGLRLRLGLRLWLG